jgi:sugar-specific transcriptional regulator TrmB
MIENTLKSVGFTDAEVKVFLALLELGSSTVTQIVEKSNTTSSKIYELLDKLIKKGLVSQVIKGGRRYYEPAPPKRILEYLKEKKQELEDQVKEVKEILPQLEIKYNLAKEVAEVSVYKGMKGIETIFSIIRDACNKGDEYYVYGAGSGVNETQKIFLLKHHKLRIKKGIKLKILFSKDVENITKPYEDMKLTEVKHMEPELMGPTQTMIVKDYAITILWKKDPVGIVVQNKDIAQSYKKYFDYLWSQDTYVTRGFKAFEDAWDSLFNKLKARESYNVFGAAFGTEGNQKRFAKYFEGLHKKRIAKGIKSRILFQQGAEKVVKKFKMEKLYSKDLKFKILPFKSEFPVEIYPQGDTTLLLIQKKEPTIITIKNKEVTESFIKFFEALWKQAK